MERNHQIELQEKGEAKGFEPATQEQLQRILLLVEELTKDCELERPNDQEEYRRKLIEVTPKLSVEVMRPEGRMAEEVAVATVYFDWKSEDKLITRCITLKQGEEGVAGFAHWNEVADNLTDIIDLGASPGLFKEHVSQLSHKDYDLMDFWPEVFNAYSQFKPLSSEHADRVLEFLNDSIELEKNGLREGDIGIWKDPETGEEHTVLIYRGEHHGWIKHKAMYYLMSPIEAGEDWEAKKVDWHDIVVNDIEGREYVLHGDVDYGWVFRSDVTRKTTLAGDTSEDAIHQLQVPYEQVPPEAMRYYDDWAEGDMGTNHAKRVRTVANRINTIWEQRMDVVEMLPEELEHNLAEYCSKVLLEMSGWSEEEEFRYLRANAWARYMDGESVDTAFYDVVKFAQDVASQDENDPNRNIYSAYIQFTQSFLSLGKPAKLDESQIN